MKENQVPRTRLCIARFAGLNYIKEMAVSAEDQVPLTCSRVCACVHACASELCYRGCVEIHTLCSVALWLPAPVQHAQEAAGFGRPELLSVTALLYSHMDHELCDIWTNKCHA